MGQCEIVGERFAARVFFSTEQDVSGNRTRVYVTRLEMRSMWDMDPSVCRVTGSIRIGGVLAVNLLMSQTGGCMFTMSTEYAGGGVDSWPVIFSSKEVWIAHSSDGSMDSLAVSVSLGVYLATGGRLDPSLDSTGYTALDRIPMVSEIQAEPVELGSPMQVELTRAVAGFTDTLSWCCGTASGVIAQDAAASVFTWTPELALAAQAPTADAVDVELRVTTSGGGQVIGERTVTVRCPIPASLVPSLEMTVSDKLDCAPRYGGYIRSRSQARVQTQAQGSLGAWVDSIDVCCGKLTGQGADVSFDLESSGQVSVSVTVTDSRGRQASARQTITVLPYEAPQAVIREAFRCDAQGTAQADGLYCRIVFDASATPVENGTTAYHAVQMVHGSQTGSQTLLDDYTGLFSVTDGSVVLPAEPDTSYDCCIQVTDSFGTVQSMAALVGVAFALLDMNRQTRAIGIGMRAKNDGKLSIGLDTDMDQHTVGNLADPVADQDAATRAYVDRCIQELARSLGLTQ